MLTDKLPVAAKNRFTLPDLRELVLAGEADARGQGWRLSLYADVPKTGREVRQGPLLLKELRQKADEELAARGLDEAVRADFLAPVDRILADTETAWLQGGGLALFATANWSAAFLVPLETPSIVQVDRRFRVEPLLPLLFEDGRFHLLALSLNAIRLFDADRNGMVQVMLEDAPHNLREAMRFEDSEAYLSFHTRASPPGAGMRRAYFFGQGGGKGNVKELKKDILDYFHQIDRGMKAEMAEPSKPLMLAGVEFLLPLFREASSHPHILDQAVIGNPDIETPEELHVKAWKLYSEEFDRERRAALERYREQIATGRTAAGLTDVVPMAHQGRIASLFLRRGYSAPGTFDPATGKTVLGEGGPAPAGAGGAEDLANIACIHTLLGDGKVYVVDAGEMPAGTDIAALARY